MAIYKTILEIISGVDDADTLRDMGYALEPIADREVRARSKNELREAIAAAVSEFGRPALAVLVDYGLLEEGRADELAEGGSADTEAPKGNEDDTGDSGESDEPPADDEKGASVELVARSFVQVLTYPPDNNLRNNDILVSPPKWITRRYKHATLSLEEAEREVKIGRRLNLDPRYSGDTDFTFDDKG